MDLLIGDVFRNAARAAPDRVAAALGDATLTFEEVNRRSNRIARTFLGRGVGRGDLVAVSAPTSLESVVVFAALAKIGAVFAPLNPGLTADEVSATVELARPTMTVTTDQLVWPLIRDRTRPITFAELADSATDASNVGCDGLQEDDTHVVFLTSGSTGRPKGVVLSHRVNFLRSHPGALLEHRGALVCPYPLFHMGAWTLALQQWQARDCVVFLARADAASICAAIDRHRATRINCIPAVWRRILDYRSTPLGQSHDLSSVRFADTGTSATPLALLEAISTACPAAQVRVFYGSTESGSVASLAHADFARKPGSCGVPGPLSEVRVADDGELLVRGPLLFDGYLDDPAATEAAFVDGWYRTGDLAEIDEGYLTIVGRARDVVRTGGETVAPEEVETVLLGHPKIADVAVVGMPDAQWGEVVCAVVVLGDGDPGLTLEELRTYCDGRLAGFKHPRLLHLVDAIPRTSATNQVQRRLLIEQIG